jgi:hypothetical protein
MANGYPDDPADPDNPDDGGDSDAGPGSPLIGEATRLIGVVGDWARQTFPAPPDGHGGPECQWCPLCQFAAVLRGERPEVTERVAEAGTALMSAMRAFIDAAASSAPGATGAERQRPRPAHVQPIDLGFGDGSGDGSDDGSADPDTA